MVPGLRVEVGPEVVLGERVAVAGVDLVAGVGPERAVDGPDLILGQLLRAGVGEDILAGADRGHRRGQRRRGARRAAAGR